MTKQYTRLRPHWRPTHDATCHGFDQWIAPDGPNGWVKILNPDGHLVRQVWAVAPEAMIVLRNHSISEQKSEMLANPEQLAQSHVYFWDDFVHDQGLKGMEHRLVFEGINEAAIWEDGVLDALVRYTVKFIMEMKIMGLVPVVLQMNTGWPTNHGVKDAPPDWTPFEPVRVALLKYGGYLGLHEYWDHRGPNSDDWGWNPGRFTQMPESWKPIPILITECGYDEAVNAPSGTGNHGYIGKLDRESYETHLYDYDQRVRESGWDVRACFIFTHDWDQPWGTFDTRPMTEWLGHHANQVRSLPRLPETTQPPPVAPPTGEGEGADTFATVFINSGRLEGRMPLTYAQGIAGWLRGEQTLYDSQVPEAITITQSRDDWQRIGTVKTGLIQAIEYEQL